METMTDLEAQVNGQIEELQGLTRNGVIDWLNDQLEVVTIKRNDELTGLEILTSFGGPNIWVILDSRGSDWLEVQGYWGGEKVTKEAYAPKVYSELVAMYELD
jgi:hypothetical protein